MTTDPVVEKPIRFIERRYARATEMDTTQSDDQTVVSDPNDYNTDQMVLLDVPDPNLVTSLILGDDMQTWHAPAIDIDIPCELIPSSTPYHYHLYFHKAVGAVQYDALLRAMTAAGLVQQGFYNHFRERGYTALRLVTNKKPGTQHPLTNTLRENAVLRRQNYLMQAMLEEVGIDVDSLLNPNPGIPTEAPSVATGFAEAVTAGIPVLSD